VVAVASRSTTQAVNGRDLRRSIRQHSAIRLAEIEGKAPLAEIGKRL
jgi:hypothetical protein